MIDEKKPIFYSKDVNGYKQVLPGISLKTIIYGEKTLMTEFLLDPNTTLPPHKHPQEQTGYLISGHIKLTIGEKTFDVFPGDAWVIPGNLEHKAYIIDKSKAVEVFSPVREDYIP